MSAADGRPVSDHTEALSLVVQRIASGAATYADMNGRRWPDLAGAVASVAPAGAERERLALAALHRLGVADPGSAWSLVVRPGKGLVGYWLILARALTAWTLQPHDHDPARRRRDDPALIAARLRGGSTAPMIAPPGPPPWPWPTVGRRPIGQPVGRIAGPPPTRKARVDRLQSRPGGSCSGAAELVRTANGGRPARRSRSAPPRNAPGGRP